MHPYSSKAFQWYQKNDNGHYGLKDINVTINIFIYLFYKCINFYFILFFKKQPFLNRQVV
jgi:hypothetical protein